jgi:hypothetical protein
MQSQSHRTCLDPVVLPGSLYISSLISGCAAGPPLGPLDIGLPPVLGLLLMIVLLIAAVLFTKTRSRRTSKPASDDSALSLLRDRYARGEIDREDFLQRRQRDLRCCLCPCGSRSHAGYRTLQPSSRSTRQFCWHRRRVQHHLWRLPDPALQLQHFVSGAVRSRFHRFYLDFRFLPGNPDRDESDHPARGETCYQ